MNPARRNRHFFPSLLVALALPLSSLGCGGLVKSIPKAAVPGVIEGGLKGMDDPENKRALAHLLASPEIKVIQQELVADLLDGSLAALDQPGRAERLSSVSSKYAASLLHAFTVNVAPELATAAATSTHGMMSAALSDDNQRQMQRLVGSLIQASVEPVIKSLSEAEISGALSASLTKDLGPAIQIVLRENLGPGLAETMSSVEMKRAMGDMAHMLGREMVLGVNEGMATTQQGRSAKSGDPSLLASANSLAQDGVAAVKFLPWVLLVMVAALGFWVWKLRGQTTRYRTETERRSEETLVLTEALRAAEGKPWSGELLSALEDRFQNDEEAVLRIRAARLGSRRRSSSGGKAGMMATKAQNGANGASTASKGA